MNYAVMTSRLLDELDILVHFLLQRGNMHKVNLRRREEGQETILNLRNGKRAKYLLVASVSVTLTPLFIGTIAHLNSKR